MRQGWTLCVHNSVRTPTHGCVHMCSVQANHATCEPVVHASPVPPCLAKVLE